MSNMNGPSDNDEPIDVEFVEVKKERKNLPAKESNVPRASYPPPAPPRGFQGSGDSDKYPIFNHLWAVQDGILFCLGLIKSYSPSRPVYDNDMYGLRGSTFFRFRGRSRPFNWKFSLICDHHQARNFSTLIEVNMNVQNMPHKSSYAVALMAVMVGFGHYPPHSFIVDSSVILKYEHHINRYKTRYNIKEEKEELIETTCEFMPDMYQFYGVDPEKGEIDYTRKIEPPAQFLLC